MFFYFEKDKHVSYYFNNFKKYVIDCILQNLYILRKKKKREEKKKAAALMRPGLRRPIMEWSSKPK